jgi:hypothetical protein
MEKQIYSRMLEERLIEKFKKEFLDKTGKVLRVQDYHPHGLPFPIISLHELQAICEDFLPKETKSDLKRKTRCLEWVYPRMIFCNLAYSMNYSIKTISNYIERDRTSVYNAIKTIDNLVSTNFLEVSSLYYNIIVKINRIHNEPNVSTMSELSDYAKSAVPGLLLQE